MHDTAAQFDKLPPHDIQAERAVLHAVINTDDRVMLTELRSIVRPDSFFQPDHREIFKVLCEMADHGDSIGPLQLQAELRRRHLLEEVGGLQHIAQIITSMPSTIHGVHFARDVAQYAKLRDLQSLATSVLNRIEQPYRGEDDLPQILLTEIQETVDQMRATSGGTDIRPLGQVLDGVLEELLGGGCPRIPTGIAALDEAMSGGPGIGEYFLIAGRPSMGKSLLSKQIARNVAVSGVPVGYVSVEESGQKFGRNFIASTADIENRLVRAGKFTHEQWQQVYKSVAYAQDLPLYITDRAMRIGDICNAITLMVAKWNCRVVVIDYIQLIEAEASTRSREQEVSSLSRRLKNLFKQLGVVGVVVAQLNRGSETGGIRPPRMSDLRDSGQLEQDADAIILIHRPGYYARDEQDDEKRRNLSEDRRAFLIPAKVRDASRENDIELHANLEYQRFDDAQPSEFTGRMVPPIAPAKPMTAGQAKDLVKLLAKITGRVAREQIKSWVDALQKFPFGRSREVILELAKPNTFPDFDLIIQAIRGGS